MHLATNTHGFPAIDGLRLHAEQRARLALEPFRDRVRALDVRIEDVEEPDRDLTVRCRLATELGAPERVVPERVLVVEQRNSPFAAVSRAALRLEETLARVLDPERRRQSA